MDEPRRRPHPAEAGRNRVNLDLVPAAEDALGAVAVGRVQHQVGPDHAQAQGLRRGQARWVGGWGNKREGERWKRATKLITAPTDRPPKRGCSEEGFPKICSSDPCCQCLSTGPVADRVIFNVSSPQLKKFKMCEFGD